MKNSLSASSKTKQIHKIFFLPFDIQVNVPHGTNLLDACRTAKIPIKASCGGKGTCGDCIVQIVKGRYRKKTSAKLPEDLSQKNYVIACQTNVEDDLIVHLPEFQDLSIKSFVDLGILENNRENLSGELDIRIPIKKIDLILPPPSLENNYSDLKILELEIKKRISINNLECEYSVLKKMASVIRTYKRKVSVILSKQGEVWKIIDIREYNSRNNFHGIACDIGTTTVALYLVNLEDGKIINAVSSYNQQIKCGEDIISRINYAKKPQRLHELQELIILTINNLIDKALNPSIKYSDIYYGSFAGNTTMIHLFLKLDPQYIREEPYVPTVNRVPMLLSRELGLNMNEEARIYCTPSIGSYVGGDIIAGLLCTPVLRSEKFSLFIDIGTNGELVLGNKEWMISCACSAGPAFEGGSISCGMPAAKGAIERIMLDDKGKIFYQVIEKGKPKGICGSGLIDLLAELFIHGIIDRYGKFNVDKAEDRIIEKQGKKGFLIENDVNCYWGKDLFITENDISNLIRAKGAVFSACSLLLKNAGLCFDQIDRFYIAGGFGKHLTIENAVRIGLLPDLEHTIFQYLGNTSLMGAYLILCSEINKDRVNTIESMMTYLELNTEPGYFNEYTGALFLPHTNKELFPSVEKLLSSVDNKN